MRRLAEEPDRALSRPREPEGEAHERGLAAAVGPGHRDELALLDREVDVREHRLARSVREADPGELDRYRHPSPSRSASRFARMTVK